MTGISDDIWDIIVPKEKLERLIAEYEKLLAVLNKIADSIEAFEPAGLQLARFVETLATALSKFQPETAVAGLEALNQTLETTSELFAAIDQIDEQRLITLVSAFEKLADDLGRVPGDVALPGAQPNVALPGAQPGTEPTLLPAPDKSVPPVIPLAPVKPDWLRGLWPEIDWERSAA